MNEPIKYISKVEIKNLWGRYDFEWNLDPEVNILSGINGSGKSTVLECIFYTIATSIISERLSRIVDSIIITLNNQDIYQNNDRNILPSEHLKDEHINIDLLRFLRVSVVSTFDILLSQNNSSDKNVRTDLDKEIFTLQKNYLDYQLNIGKKAFDIVSKNEVNAHDEVLLVSKQRERFIEIINLLFNDTNKKVDTDSNELNFLCKEGKLTPYQLSSGEKQILIILLKVLVQDNKPSILFMDEPEVSLHIDWQRKLIQYIRELNPNVQIIIATHSPGIIMDGWMDKVFEMSDLVTLDRKAKS